VEEILDSSQTKKEVEERLEKLGLSIFLKEIQSDPKAFFEFMTLSYKMGFEKGHQAGAKDLQNKFKDLMRVSVNHGF
jgi:hypothetical protein